MSHHRGSSPQLANPRELIPVNAKLANRFYEPIVLILALNQACILNRPTRTPDLQLDLTQSVEYNFHRFVDKLAQLCHNERSPDSITSFVVLKFPDHIQYQFACNQRKEVDLVRTQKFITSILQSLGKAPSHTLMEMVSPILRKCLAFTRPRVQIFVSALRTQTANCIGICEKQETGDSTSILEKLENLQKLLVRSDDPKLDDATFSERCEDLINAIDELHHSDVNKLIRERTNEGRINESLYWCEMRHAAGRLLSYQQAVNILVETRRKWQELFEDFQVHYVTSSAPGPNPLRKSGNQLSADAIIGRMTSEPHLMESYKAQAQDLQKFELDDIIRREAMKKGFRPIVHAEVLLLEALERNGGTHPSRFFNGYKYIGCSKPSCRLCDYYFSNHQSGVQIRPAHGNVYPSWRMPDLFQDQGPKVERERKILMNKMLLQTRKDAFRVLSEKLPERKEHDSNTEPTFPVNTAYLRLRDDNRSMEAMLNGLQIRGLNDQGTTRKGADISDRKATFPLESDDEEDGGAKI